LKEITRALEENTEASSKWMQLGTLCKTDNSFAPAVRTVVFRGFVTTGNGSTYLKVIADRRSKKIKELQINSNFSLCSYFPKSHEQFRISGFAQIVNYSEEESWEQTQRQLSFKELSNQTRAQFVWPKYDGDDTVHVHIHEISMDSEKTILDKANENFSLILLKPTSVDHLQLKPFPNVRTIYKLEEDHWKVIKDYP